MRPRTRPGPDATRPRPRPKILASRPRWPRGLNISGVYTCVEGKRAAKKRDCKYTEISATIGHNVDQLLVGVLQQIRLSRRHEKLTFQSPSSTLAVPRNRAGSVAAVPGYHACRLASGGVNGSCLVHARHRLLAKIVSSLSLNSSLATSSVCDNLYVL